MGFSWVLWGWVVGWGFGLVLVGFVEICGVELGWALVGILHEFLWLLRGFVVFGGVLWGWHWVWAGAWWVFWGGC